MISNLRIEIKRVCSWESFTCNDCDNTSTVKLKFPKFDVINVCNSCYREYYKDQVERGGYRKGK